MASQTMLAGMKFSINGTPNSHATLYLDIPMTIHGISAVMVPGIAVGPLSFLFIFRYLLQWVQIVGLDWYTLFLHKAK